MTAGPDAPAPPVVTRVLPDPGERGAAALVADLHSTAPLRPFAPDVVGFCADLARALSRAGRGVPEIEALAFWSRRSEVARLEEAFRRLEDDRTLLVPRGTVFHVPPANVDTLFVYSWLMATVTGNRNVVRLSSRATDQSTLMLDVIARVLDAHDTVRAATSMVTYGHQREITDELSGACDVRVIWGGDATVRSVRNSPLPAHAVDVTFPDRFSFAVIRAEAYVALEPEDRDRLVKQFFNDAYGFDQLGCSSPRLLVWVGSEDECASSARHFFARLHQTIRSNGYAVDTAAALAKFGYSVRAMIDQPVTSYASYGNALTVLPVADFPAVRGEFCGAGLFFQLAARSLDELTVHIERRDQTLAQYGFAQEDLRRFATSLNGRGIDRVVPIGDALTFNRVWDGNDLLQVFTRRVTIDSGGLHAR